MRAVALLFLPVMAALACVGAVAIATGSPGKTQSFVWKKHAFTTKQEFAAWLERRNLTYAGWAERHPGTSPPWEDEGPALGRLALLVGALAIILAFLVRTRDIVSSFARGALLSVLARLPEERPRAVAPAHTDFSLRDAVSVYGLRASRGAESRREPERPELVLVGAPPAESVVAVEPDVDAVRVESASGAAIAKQPEPELAVDAPPARRRRAVLPARVGTTPRISPAPVQEPLRPESDPEPESAAADPEPETGAVEARPTRRQRATSRPRKTAVGKKRRMDPPVAENPVHPELDPAATAVELDPKAVAVDAPPDSSAPVEPAQHEEPVIPDSTSGPAASSGVSELEAEQAAPSADRETALAQPPPEPVPVPLASRPSEAHRAPAPPTWPSGGVVCEVAFWRGYFNGQFYARIRGEDRLSAVATSPMFRCSSGGPEQTQECLAALAALNDLLAAEGWQPFGRGRAWYAVRFMNDDAG
jgi:hypothetical protein